MSYKSTSGRSQPRVVVVGGSGVLGLLCIDALDHIGWEGEGLSRGSDGPWQESFWSVDLDVREGLATALSGATAVVYIPSLAADVEAHARSVALAASEAGIERSVLVSARAASPGGGSMLEALWNAEQTFRKCLPGTVAVRTGLYTQNIFLLWDEIARHGTFRLPLGDGPTALVDARDVAHVITVLLTSEHSSVTVNIDGPTIPSGSVVAGSLSLVAGREVTYRNMDADELADMAATTERPKSFWSLLQLAQEMSTVSISDTDDFYRVTKRRARRLGEVLGSEREMLDSYERQWDVRVPLDRPFAILPSREHADGAVPEADHDGT